MPLSGALNTPSFSRADLAGHLSLAGATAKCWSEYDALEVLRLQVQTRSMGKKAKVCVWRGRSKFWACRMNNGSAGQRSSAHRDSSLTSSRRNSLRSHPPPLCEKRLSGPDSCLGLHHEPQTLGRTQGWHLSSTPRGWTRGELLQVAVLLVDVRGFKLVLSQSCRGLAYCCKRTGTHIKLRAARNKLGCSVIFKLTEDLGDV